jgi:nitrite reductase/ring-hydroxylating ferredoxin subunit
MQDHGELTQRWFPIAGVCDLAPRHVFEAQLLGQELAIWRGASGSINVWENRCPHRGVRLTLGANLGTVLRCAYHGFRYAERTGRCLAIPAHPDRRPPIALSVKLFPVVERHGLVWTALDANAPAPASNLSEEGRSTKLYSMPFNASAVRVTPYLLGYRFRPTNALHESHQLAERSSTRSIDTFTFEATATHEGATTTVLLFSQPVTDASMVVHGCLVGETPSRLLNSVLRHHYLRMSELRAAVERDGLRTASR